MSVCPRCHYDKDVVDAGHRKRIKELREEVERLKSEKRFTAVELKDAFIEGHQYGNTCIPSVHGDRRNNYLEERVKDWGESDTKRKAESDD